MFLGVSAKSFYLKNQVLFKLLTVFFWQSNTKVTDKKWLQNFMTKHPEISLHPLWPTSLARANEFNKTQANRIFVLIENLTTPKNLTINHIYNIDNLNINAVQSLSNESEASTWINQKQRTYL